MCLIFYCTILPIHIFANEIEELDEAAETETTNENSSPEQSRSPIVRMFREKPSLDLPESHQALIIGISQPVIKYEFSVAGNDVSDKGYYQIESSPNINLGYEWSQFRHANWNHGFLIDVARYNFKSIAMKGMHDATSSNPTELPGSITLFTAGYNGNFRLNDGYIGFGIGYSSSSISDNDGDFTKNIRTLYSRWINLGYIISEKYLVEALIRTHTLTADKITKGNLVVNPVDGYLTVFQLNLKVMY